MCGHVHLCPQRPEVSDTPGVEVQAVVSGQIEKEMSIASFAGQCMIFTPEPFLQLFPSYLIVAIIFDMFYYEELTRTQLLESSKIILLNPLY